MNYRYPTDMHLKKKLYFFRSRATSHLRARIRLQGEGCREVLRLLNPELVHNAILRQLLGEVEKLRLTLALFDHLELHRIGVRGGVQEKSAWRRQREGESLRAWARWAKHVGRGPCASSPRLRRSGTPARTGLAGSPRSRQCTRGKPERRRSRWATRESSAGPSG